MTTNTQVDSFPRDEELAESVAAVKAAFAEIDNEDAWVDVDDHLAELRSKYGLSERP